MQSLAFSFCDLLVSNGIGSVWKGKTVLEIGEAELDLIGAVATGPFDVPMWSSFLEKLRAMTGAQFAVMNFRPPRRPFDESVTVLSGATLPEFELTLSRFNPPADPPMDESLIEGRLYSLEELSAGNLSREMQLHSELLRKAGATGLRHVRMQEPSGINAWLTVVRVDGTNFDPASDNVLTLSCRFLRIALRNYIAIERERYGAQLTAQAVRGLFGWISLDAAGLVLDCDEQGANFLANSEIVSRASSGRLSAKPVALEREIYTALNSVATQANCRPQVITLNRDPWLDMMIVPARRKSLAASNPPVAIAYVHGDSWRNADRQEQLAQLFRLSPGEARLALALCRGMTIAEAAAEFGLAVGTARNYCKSIFAKTGARGQPDLVRIIMRSVLSLAPDA